MKKYLLIPMFFIAAFATSYAGCGGCEKGHDHGKEKAECAEKCEKSSCCEKKSKAECAEKCEKSSCCAEKKECCGSGESCCS